MINDRIKRNGMGNMCLRDDGLSNSRPVINLSNNKLKSIELKKVDYVASDEMIVNVFLVTINDTKKIINMHENLHNLIIESGNIPQFCVYEGQYPHYLMCIDANTDPYKLCKKHNLVVFSGINKMKIKKNKYNRDHCVNPIYSLNSFAPKYRLEKIICKYVYDENKKCFRMKLLD